MSRRAKLAAALRPLLREEGQAVTESSIILSGMLLMVFVGLPTVMHWAPEMLEALTIYIRGFYIVLGFPMG